MNIWDIKSVVYNADYKNHYFHNETEVVNNCDAIFSIIYNDGIVGKLQRKVYVTPFIKNKHVSLIFKILIIIIDSIWVFNGF